MDTTACDVKKNYNLIVCYINVGLKCSNVKKYSKANSSGQEYTWSKGHTYPKK